MNSLILDVFFVFLVALFFGSVALSLFLLYDIKSGNYRKFFPAEDGRKAPTEAGQLSPD